MFQHDNVRSGFVRIHIGTTAADFGRRADLAALLAQLPADAKVVASERLVPHVSNRSDAYTLRFGIFDADYLLFQMPIGGEERARARGVLLDGTFGVVDDRGTVALAKRGHPTTENAAMLSRMGN